MISLSLIDQVVLLGIAVVLPLCLGDPWWWGGAAGAALLSFLGPAGPYGLLTLPFLLVAVATSMRAVRAAGPISTWTLGCAVDVLAPLYAVVAAGALAQSRFGLQLLDLREPIIELTSVHYMFAGSAALVLAGRTLSGAARPWRQVAIGAVLLTAVAPPVVAVGFLTSMAAPQVGGAVIMTLGVWATATLQLRHVRIFRRYPVEAVLLGVSGVAIWVPMVLAVAWAAGQHWDVPFLSVPDMARTHGLANAFAFTLCGLVARHLGRGRAPAHQERPG